MTQTCLHCCDGSEMRPMAIIRLAMSQTNLRKTWLLCRVLKRIAFVFIAVQICRFVNCKRKHICRHVVNCPCHSISFPKPISLQYCIFTVFVMHYIFVSLLCPFSCPLPSRSLTRHFKMFLVAFLDRFAKQHENAETRTQTNYIDHNWIWPPSYEWWWSVWAVPMSICQYGHPISVLQ